MPGDLMNPNWNVTYQNKPETGLVTVTVSRRLVVGSHAGDVKDANADGSAAVEASPEPSSSSTNQADKSIPVPVEEIYSFDTSRIRGVSFPPWLREKRWEALTEKVHLRPSDIVVATYPKSGTTLMEQAILAFLSGAKDPDLFRAADKNAIGRRSIDSSSSTFAKVWPEACLGWAPGEDSGETKRGAEFAPLSYEAFVALPAPRLIKTHAPAHMVPGALSSPTSTELEGSSPGCPGSTASASNLALSGAKFVVVARAPKDVCTSSFYHAWSPAKSGWPFEAWASAWLEGATPSGGWVQWHAGWREAIEPLQVEGGESVGGDEKGSSVESAAQGLLLTYEAMTSVDETVRLEAFRTLGRFVLPTPSTGRSIDAHGDASTTTKEHEEAEFEALVRRVDNLCQFDAMKAQALTALKNSAPAAAPVAVPATNDSSSARASTSSNSSHHGSNLGIGHMRHGKAGNWAEHFTSALAAHFDARCSEEARCYGLE